MGGSDQGHIGFDWGVNAITVGDRHRRDMGDLTPLMDSINEYGLIQLITITPEGVLICGARRLEAVKRLGWKTVNVWVRTGLSDRLAQLMAERDDHTTSKPYTTAEMASLYAELKAEIAADAARRVQSAQFEDGHPYLEHGLGKFPRPSFGTPVGDARLQAAGMLGDPGAHRTLEKVAWITQTSNDPTQPQNTRDLARQAASEIEDGAKVDGWFLQVRNAVRLDQMRQTADDPDLPDPVREAAREGVILLAKLEGEEPMSPADVDKAGRSAMERVKAAKKAQPKTRRRRNPEPKKRPVKQLIWTWNEISTWPAEYDIHAVAQTLTDQQWEQFKQAIEDWGGFRQQVAAARADLGLPA